MKIPILIIPFVLFFLSCGSNSVTGPSSSMLVVRGYLYANEPVWDIQITSDLALGSQDSVPPPINDARVILIKNGTTYELTPSVGDSGYYHYEGDDLTVEAGDQFEIQVEHDDKSAQGATIVPDPPSGISLDRDTLYVPSFTGGFPPQPGGFDRDAMQLDVTWDEEADGLFYVVVENIEENPQEISTGFRGGNFQRRFVFPPTNRNEYRINAMQLTHLGRHIVRVYKVNQEYADLYRTREQDSRELNEPLTNISGGLGIFSAFNSATAEFYVTSE